MDIWYALILIMALLCAWLLLQRFAGAGRPESEGEDKGGTGILPSMYMYQLDPGTMREGECFVMNDQVLNGDGYTISGSHAKRGALRLSGKYQEARYVSEEAATVFKDTDGCYYIQDNDSRNGMKLPDSRDHIKKIQIDNRMVVYLGIQPIKFVFVDNIGRGCPVDEAEQEQPVVRQKPVRRITPVYRSR